MSLYVPWEAEQAGLSFDNGESHRAGRMQYLHAQVGSGVPLLPRKTLDLSGLKSNLISKDLYCIKFAVFLTEVPLA